MKNLPLSDTPRTRLTTRLFLSALALCCLLLASPREARANCVSGACMAAGPRLASIDSTRGALLNAVLGNLLGTNVSLSVADWNAVAQGDVDLVRYLDALKAQVGVSTPAQALGANATLLQLVSALAVVAQADGNTALVNALNVLRPQISGLSGTIRLSDLLVTTLPPGALANVQLDVLDLLTGQMQLYNYRNVLTTPSPITLGGGALGLGAIANVIQLYAQVIEPPVYACGPTGTQFHSAAVRLKLDIDLIDLHPDSSALGLLVGVTGASISIGQLELYVEIARAEGTLATVNAAANAVTIQATPGVADLHLGHMSDAVFFNRTHVINAASDLDYANIGMLSINALTVGIGAKTSARGQAPFSSTLSFTGPYPQTRTANTSAAFVANLLDSLVANLQLRVTPSLGLLDAVVLPTVKLIVRSTITPLLSTVLSGLADPLLSLLGIRLGEVVVSVYGIAEGCTVSGRAYADANHNRQLDGGESGTGLTLYAKLLSTAVPGGPARQVVTVDPATGAYDFPTVAPGSYLIVLDDNNAASDASPHMPAGWVGTETPSGIRSDVTMMRADVTGRNFGLFNGSRITGAVFLDDGSGGGTARDGTRNGAEHGLAGVPLRVTDTAGTNTFDSALTDASGNYTLYVAAAAGAVTLKVSETNSGGYVSTGGSAGTTGGAYDPQSDATSFTNTPGASYTGVDFADAAAPPLVSLDKSVTPGGEQVPGTDLAYTIAFSNVGGAPATGLIVTDAIPSSTDFKVGSAAASLDATGLTVAIEYSSDGGTNWSYTPSAGAGGAPAGYDRLVTHVRWVFGGNLIQSTPANAGAVSFTTRIR